MWTIPVRCNIHNVYQYVHSHATHSMLSITVWQAVSTSYIGHQANYTETRK